MKRKIRILEFEEQKREILKAVGFKFDSKSDMWKMKLNYTVVFHDSAIENCNSIEWLDEMIRKSFKHHITCLDRIKKRKRLLVKLLR